MLKVKRQKKEEIDIAKIVTGSDVATISEFD